MDVPLAINDIKIQHGLKDNKEKSSMFSEQTGVRGLSAFDIPIEIWMHFGEYMI